MKKTATLISTILFFLFYSFSQIYSNGAKLVLDWQLNEGKGYQINDSSGNRITGRLNSGQWIPSQDGFALNWSEPTGQGGFIDFDEGTLLDIRNGITVEVRIKLDEYPVELKPGKARQTTIIMAPAWSLGVREHEGVLKLRATVRLGSDEFGPSSIGWYGEVVPLNRWVTIGFTYDSESSDINFYMEGKRVGGRNFRKTDYDSWKLNPAPASSWKNHLNPQPYGPYTMIIRPEQRAGYTDFCPFLGSIEYLKIWDGVRDDW